MTYKTAERLVPELNGMDPDDVLAHRLAFQKWVERGRREGEYPPLVRTARGLIRAWRAAGLNPHALGGEDAAPRVEPAGWLARWGHVLAVGLGLVMALLCLAARV